MKVKQLIFKRNPKHRSPTMRAKRTSQISIFDQFAAHDIGRELAGMGSNPTPLPLSDTKLVYVRC